MNHAGRKGSVHQQKKITRRKFLKSTGAAALAVSGGLGILAGRAPAFAKERTLHVVAWKHFIREADALMRDEFIPEFKRASGIQVTYETIDANDLNARVVAALQSNRGPDIFQLIFNMPHLYAEDLTNHDELAADVGVERQYDHLKEAAKADGVMRGIPYYMTGTANVYRKDIFEKLNIGQTPATWDDYLRIGTKLKDFGMPVGQTLGHTFADAPMFTYP
ncbi:MAG: ABC transporter substrate-binding protein, partial [bacterium]